MQDDILFPDFSPREALLFAARLKLGGDLKSQEARVDELIEDLGLSQVANVLIGSVA